MSEEGTYALVLRPGASTETGGTAVCGFSNVGMVGVIAASHLVRTLELEQRATTTNKIQKQKKPSGQNYE